jgi:hypothetical protein
MEATAPAALFLQRLALRAVRTTSSSSTSFLEDFHGALLVDYRGLYHGHITIFMVINGDYEDL